MFDERRGFARDLQKKLNFFRISTIKLSFAIVFLLGVYEAKSERNYYTAHAKIDGLASKCGHTRQNLLSCTLSTATLYIKNLTGCKWKHIQPPSQTKSNWCRWRTRTPRLLTLLPTLGCHFFCRMTSGECLSLPPTVNTTYKKQPRTQSVIHARYRKHNETIKLIKQKNI